jgi:type II secretory pathway component GspD/PulD (secretin)
MGDNAQMAQAPVQAAPQAAVQPELSANGQSQFEGQGKPGSSLVDEVRTRQLIELQRLREMKINAEKQANQLAGLNKLAEAIATLETGVKTLKSSALDADQIRPMQLQLESRIKQLTMMREQQDLTKMAETERQAKNEVAKRLAMADATKKEKVADLMKQYKTFMDEGKYTEAVAVAMKMQEVNPDDPAVTNAYETARTRRALTRENDALKMKEIGVSDSSIGLVQSATPPTMEHMDHPEYPKDWQLKTHDRKKWTSLPARLPTKEDKEVTSKLDMTVSVDFKNKPLGDALNELRAMTSINIVPDMVNLQTDNVSLDQPVTMSLDKVRLKTALDLLLKNARLTYIVHDGVLLVTTPAGQKGRNERKIFAVADLIVPVDNMANVADGRLKGNDTTKAVTELLSGLGNSNLQVNVANPPGSAGYIPGGGQQPTSGKSQRQAGQTMEEQLMKLIVDTIEPQSWDVMGGSGHIEFYPLNMTLVVSQTPDIQEQIQQLLERLRDLQNLQVTVEVRFLTLSEDFYERIGVDFDINILSRQRKFEREVVAGAFAPAGQINAPHEHNVIVGLTPQGTVTQDLNIPINSSSFQQAIPPFGGFPNQAGANGGLDMGVAFLSDIEVFLFMEAAQGDKRTSILTAPKITLYNGQTAAISVSRVQPYVATIITIPGNFGGAPGQFPIIQNAVSQTSLAVQAVVSADRRYVQLTLNPIIQRTTLNASTEFTFNSGGPFGTQTIQQPITDTLALGTTVSVPDGGTILLGGFKNLNEGRNEFGPPILSKIPYVNRLFTNTAYGREEQSLLFMVTPHIIIPEEEEERLGQTFAF